MAQTAAQTSKPLRLCVLGSFRLTRDGTSIRLPTRKAESLLAYLVLYPEPHAREKLAALLWGDVSDAQARGSLRKALTHLRLALGSQAIEADRQAVRWNADLPLRVDALEFETLTQPREINTLDALNDVSRQLDDLYRGEFLADVFDDWTLAWRERYHDRHLNFLLGLVQGLRVHSEYTLAAELAQRVLAADPANERAHQHLMFCHVGLGDRHAALNQYQLCVRALADELGVEPSNETQELYQWIQQFGAERTSSAALPTNLAIPFSSFIGRQQDTAALKAYLDAGARLVTLTGPGGSGKTRLAIQTATDLICAGEVGVASSPGLPLRDGIWWVELAALTDASHIADQIAKTLGVRGTGQEPIQETVKGFLKTKALLLVLDNCEHVIDTCARLTHDLLLACPNLKILATSREALRVAGEQVYPVPTLSVPRRGAWSYLDLLNTFDGIRLFVERAHSVDPHFQLTEDNAAAVIQICARLDGIPLALELAASRTRILSPQEIAARLDERFDLLRDANRAAPARHQTLRAVLDWSYDLLDERERTLFRRCAVFAGGFTLDALYELVPDQSSAAVLDTLTHLIDKSLVVVSRQGTSTRYGMLETIREYALGLLKDSDDARTLKQRHLEIYLLHAERTEPILRGPEQNEQLARLETELENLRLALAWALAHDTESGLRLAGALEWFWNLRGYWNEGADWLARLLAADTGASIARARALVATSNLTYWGEQDYATARRMLEQSLELYAAAPQRDTWGESYALSLYGRVLDELGERARGREALETALMLGNSLGEIGRWVAAWALLFLAWTEDDPGSARVDFQTGVAYFRALGDRAQLQVALAQFAWFCIGQQDFANASAFAEEALELTLAIGDRLGAAWIQALRGDIARAQDDQDRAAEYYTLAYARFQELGNTAGMAETRARQAALQPEGVE